MADLAIINAGELVTCAGDASGDGLGIIEDGAFLVEGGNVVWVGTTKEFKRKSLGKSSRIIDASDNVVLPGFVDPHTHLAFAGSREDELERKVSGESYVKILKGGGGIARTIRETRRASTSRIVRESKDRVRQLMMNGVTTVEVKSGYGQNLKGELKLLAAIGRLRSEAGIEVVPTFLGLHTTPPEFPTSNEYVDYVVRKMLPAVAALRSRPVFADCFCEVGIFSVNQCLRYLKASAGAGFALKIHADEFNDSGGAELAAEVGCVSADHLGRSAPWGIEAMARSRVAAVVLPGTSLYSDIPYADARKMIGAGCTVALGTDLSPNSWIESPQLVMGLACMGGRMSPAQALMGFTRNAALALGRKDIGIIDVGSSADFVVMSVPSYRFLPYRIGGDYVRSVFRAGNEVFSRPTNA